MTATFLEKIDWSRPWLAHVRDLGRAIAQAPDWRAALDQHAAQAGLRNHRGMSMRFIPQAELPAGVAYESHISRTGCVPTRENLHDFFNALVWLTYPRIKARLNALQAAEIDRNESSGGTSSRGRVRDAATIFDENAVLLVTPDQALIDALRAHRWTDAFLIHRDAFAGGGMVYLFGHALMEKLIAPYKAITGHMWVLPAVPPAGVASFTECQAWMDEEVASRLSPELATKDFSPLPVLGVPGWWRGQDVAFYRDTAVFRPARINRVSG